MAWPVWPGHDRAATIGAAERPRRSCVGRTNPRQSGYPAATNGGVDTDCLPTAAVDEGEDGPRLVIADPCRDDAWLSVAADEATSLVASR